MACRGVHFALTDEQAARLLAATSDELVMEIIQEEIEERWDEEWLVETDKAWDAIHRCLSDGTLSCPGTSVLEKCILGGKNLYSGDDYVVSLLGPNEVRQVADALQMIGEDGLSSRYREIDADDYGITLSKGDEDYTWDYFMAVKEFFRKVASSGHSVVFTADQ
ncbi:MAG: DUF1877 family protein [Phycisphaerales bacterium]|nr:MAG: DUF1877 family protein [Phycisphaerales bacterium]